MNSPTVGIRSGQILMEVSRTSTCREKKGIESSEGYVSFLAIRAAAPVADRPRVSSTKAAVAIIISVEARRSPAIPIKTRHMTHATMIPRGLGPPNIEYSVMTAALEGRIPTARSSKHVTIMSDLFTSDFTLTFRRNLPANKEEIAQTLIIRK